MTELVLPEKAFLSMTSREIAELAGKRHDNVLRDIDALVSALSSELRTGFKPSTYVSGDPPREYRQFDLDRDASICLVTGYDVTSRMKIIKRWQELEARLYRPSQDQPKLPVEIGEATVLGMLRVAEMCGVPKSYAIQVSAAEATRQSGMPWDLLLTQAAAMNNVPQEDIMLEPTELGRLFDLSAVAMNKRLAEMGLQVKEGGEWVPTQEGLTLSSKHAWVRGSKSGYNLKWKAVEIERRMS